MPGAPQAGASGWVVAWVLMPLVGLQSKQNPGERNPPGYQGGLSLSISRLEAVRPRIPCGGTAILLVHLLQLRLRHCQWLQRLR